MQVQSATDTPKNVILGERPVMVDGNEYNVLIAKEGGKPIETVYASEGSPIILMPSAIFKEAPHPNAAAGSRITFSPPKHSSCSSMSGACTRFTAW